MAQAVLCAVFCMSETNNGMTNDCLENLFRLHVVVCSGGSFSLGCGLSYVAWAQGRHVPQTLEPTTYISWMQLQGTGKSYLVKLHN